MKKIIVLFLLIVILANCALALDISNITDIAGEVGGMDKVPVIDEKAVEALSRIADVLDSILTIHGDELKKLNLSTSQLLQTQFQQAAGKVVVDSAKAQQYIKTLSEIEGFIKKREEKANDLDAYNEALKEARTVGAYSGLQDFANSLDCINPRIRDELIDHLANTLQELDVSLDVEKFLEPIPDCAVEEEITMPVTLKPKFFAWLSEPFKLNIAAITQPSSPGSEEVTSITLTPRLQETEDSIELSNLEGSALTLIKNNASQKEEERKKEIGKVWPIEKCKEMIVDKDVNGGQPLCKEYQTLISGEEIEKLKPELSLNNPLNNPIQAVDFYEFFTPQNIANQAGINASSSVSTSSDFGGPLGSKDKIKKSIDQICASYKSTSTTSTMAYALCIKEFNKQLKRLINMSINEVREKGDHAQKVQKQINSIKSKLEELKTKIDPNVCPKAYHDLDAIDNELEGKNKNYLELIKQFSNMNAKLNNSMNELDKTSKKIDNLIDDVLNTQSKIVNVLDKLMGMFQKQGQISIFGIKLNVHKISEALQTTQYYSEEILRKVQQAVQTFDQALESMAGITSNLNDFSYELYKTGNTYSALLNDVYELDLTLQKLAAYEKLAKECSAGSASSQKVSLIKNKVIVVETKSKEKPSFNFLASLKNLFKPKIVEISNEK